MLVQTMQLCSLGQETVSQWSIVPRCPRVLQVLPTMSDCWDCESWDTWELSDIVGSTCNTLGQFGTMVHGDTVPCPKEQSCIVWTNLYSGQLRSCNLGIIIVIAYVTGLNAIILLFDFL